MNFALNTIDEVLVNASNENLYVKLIDQINKDFNLSNIHLDLFASDSPQVVKTKLQDKIYSLISDRFSDYLNLLYVTDIPEEKIKTLNGADLFILSEQVCYLILIREWQKVWFRNNY